MLSADEEFMLAKAWADRGDTQAAHKMVTSTFASSRRSLWGTAATACPSRI